MALGMVRDKSELKGTVALIVLRISRDKRRDGCSKMDSKMTIYFLAAKIEAPTIL
jgi:hypothetical protein